MRIGAGLSTDPDTAAATSQAAEQAAAQLGPGHDPTIAVVVASRHHAEHADLVSKHARTTTRTDHLIGCIAEVVIGGPREVEDQPAVSVWLAHTPQPPDTFHMDFVRTAEGGVFGGWRFEDTQGPEAPYLLIADPFSFPADPLLGHLNERLPGTLVMGGMASGAVRPGQTRLFVDDRIEESGAVGARLPGVAIRSLVSQGCRPIGDAYTVTKAEANLIHELGGKPPMERLRDIAAGLSPEDRELIGKGLHIGRVIDEYKAEPGRGDYLIRGVIGVDADTGAMAVGDHVEVGQSVRFHVRDAQSADEDLRGILEHTDAKATGALLFTCNGRGSRLFDEPNHDAKLVSDTLGGLPLAGLNCAGEIGPVGGKNFLHGFTASIALFDDQPDR